MLTTGVLSKFGITVPEGKVCTHVHIKVTGKKGILKTVTNGKQLEQMANKYHGTILKPVFASANDGETI